MEKLKIHDAMSHITTNKRVLDVRAVKSEVQFGVVSNLAERIKMRVNENKTQLLCIHANKFNVVSSFIRTTNGNITSTNELKILGFFFDNKPNATHHVKKVIEKFHGKLWTLRFLKRGGMDRANLLKVYYTVILPAAEYCSIIYGPLIPKYVSDQLEAVQKQAYKIIYGYGVDYAGMVERGEVETLESRREEKMKKFALSAERNPRFREKWFIEKEEIGIQMRNGVRRRYEEPQYKNERLRNNPVSYMIRILNSESIPADDTQT